MMKKYAWFMIVLLHSGLFRLSAQTVVIRETVETPDTTSVNNDGVGFIEDLTFFGGGNQSGIKGTLTNSMGVNFMMNVKLPLGKHFAVPLLFGINNDVYGFEREGLNNTFPDSFSFDRMRFTLWGAGFGSGIRCSINPKSYLEAGAVIKWYFSTGYKYEYKDSDRNRVKVNVRNPDYINRLNYDVFFRAGFVPFTFTAYYRLSDLFSSTASVPVTYEMPRLRIGVGFGL